VGTSLYKYGATELGNTSGLTRESGPRELTAVATQCRVSMVKSVQS
jgi:hypothetical protein